MKKSYLMMAAAAALFAACSSDSLTTEKQSPQTQDAAVEQAVEFGAYVSRGTTRAGVNGPLTTDNLKKTSPADPHNTAGFGVFGYYTNGESYTGSSRPDFFYNQQVAWDGTKWKYTPMKYWPNEFGSDAISDQVDKVTLFAYAPWVEVTPLTGLVTAGAPNNALNITGMTRNNATGDPLIKYTSSMMSDNSVDLCYGVAANAFTSSNSASNPNNIAAGSPYVDVVKPGTDANSKINFDFKHALAQLNVTIDAKVTDLTNGGSAVETNYTRIWVRSITFEGITQTGALNLNSKGDSPNWYDVNGTSLITTGSLTVYDGRKDGREANESASSETPATLNPSIVQSEVYPDAPTDFSAAPVATGVTQVTKNLFRKADGTENATTTDPIFVIPTKEKMKVVIVYDVETADENLATVLSDGSRKGSTIENRIYKTIDGFGNIEAGKKYTLNLHLGMRTVDFEASVTPWDESYGGDIDLPANMLTFAAGASDASKVGEVKISYDGDFTFAMSGFVANAPITTTPAAPCTAATVNSKSDGSGTPDQASATGVVYVTSTTITPNTTTSSINTGRVTMKNSGNTKGGYVEIIQGPHPLNMSVTSLTGSSLVLAQDGALSTPFTSATVVVKNVSTDAEIYNGAGAATITLTATPALNDVLKITVTSGEVVETISYKVN